ncbi:MAG TPA: PD-(D/E)XK nuclease family protein [Candidatus Nitrosocosmicus sp.]|nr:PD-(D/E)XK nuclease family protein [Candidatus Nitrosocosmicus sp.]
MKPTPSEIESLFNLDELITPPDEFEINSELQKEITAELENPIDFRLRNLSYSGSNILHACPRKYQLTRLQSQSEDEDLTGMRAVTFAFGHAVGDGIQAIISGVSLEEVLLNTFLSWPVDLYLNDEDQKKNVYYPLPAITTFESIFTAPANELSDYELYYYTDSEGNKVPAIELPFYVELPDGFKHRGKADVVLIHKETKQLLVLEVKTDGSKDVNPAKYKNSAQALGYSVVLDAIAPGYSSYTVLYVVYNTKLMCYQMFEFLKTRYMRAMWISQIMLDAELIKMYEGIGSYPMYGESCYDWGRECGYYNLCTLSTENLVQPLSNKELGKLIVKNKEYFIRVTISDLIAAQMQQ